jgi:hypothetical protein
VLEDINRRKGMRYRTYLLTCWQENEDKSKDKAWRYRLETPLNGQRAVFSTLQEAVVWIKDDLDQNQ